MWSALCRARRRGGTYPDAPRPKQRWKNGCQVEAVKRTRGNLHNLKYEPWLAKYDA